MCNYPAERGLMYEHMIMREPAFVCLCYQQIAQPGVRFLADALNVFGQVWTNGLMPQGELFGRVKRIEIDPLICERFSRSTDCPELFIGA